MNHSPIRCGRRAAHLIGTAAVALGLAASGVVCHVGRAEDDRIVSDEELAAAEPGAATMQGGNVQDLEQQFDMHILNALGMGHQAAMIRGRGQLRVNRNVVVLNGIGGGQVVVNGNGGVVVVNGKVIVKDGQVVEQGGDSPEPADDPVVAALRTAAEPRFTRLETISQPSADQRRLLRLALDSDIRRAADVIDRERRKYVGATVNLVDQAGQQKWQQFHQDIQTCNQFLQAFTRGADGLFSKVTATVLEGEQVARLESEFEAVRAHRWKMLIGLALTRWDEVLGLDQSQYEGIERLLVEKRPPLRVGSTLPSAAGLAPVQQAMWLVPLALEQVGEQRAREVISERQWKLMSRSIPQARQMRQHLEQAGILETATK